MKEKAPSYLDFDRSGILPESTWLVGVDEAGRGPLAGPVFAAAVAIHRDAYANPDRVMTDPWVRDSKQLSATRRNEVYADLMGSLTPEALVQVGVGSASVSEIDRLNILEATKLAMFRALMLVQGRLHGANAGLVRAEAALFELGACLTHHASVQVWVDGRPLKHFPFAHHAIVKGDGKSLCIALASIVAKVERDACMVDCHQADSRYGWHQNKGYGTLAHRNALLAHGPSLFHRRSFLGKILAGG